MQSSFRVSAFAAAIALAAATAGAASVSETFEGLTGNGTVDISGSSSVPGFTLSTAGGAAPYSSIVASPVFPGIGSTKAFQVNGSVNDWPQFNGGAINLAPGPVIQMAMPVRVTGLDAADTDVDLLTLDTTANSYSPYYNIRANANLFRTTDENGWPGSTSPISTTAFDFASASNWLVQDSGRWHLLAFSIKPNATTGSYKVWDIDPSTGIAVLLQDYAGPAVNPTVQATVPRFCLGLCIAGSAVGTANTTVVIDDLTWWDDAFADDNAFLSAVRTKYATASGVSDWSVY